MQSWHEQQQLQLDAAEAGTHLDVPMWDPPNFASPNAGTQTWYLCLLHHAAAIASYSVIRRQTWVCSHYPPAQYARQLTTQHASSGQASLERQSLPCK